MSDMISGMKVDFGPDCRGELTLLIPGSEIRTRIDELAEEISADRKGITADNPLLVLCTLRGAVFFAADLVRRLTLPCELDFLKVHCYVGERPVGSPIFDLGESIDVTGRRVLIVEDIVDTGQTMHTVLQNFHGKGAEDIRICTLLDKPSRRLPEIELVPDYIGFETEDVFVVGWGLDFDGHFRLLPDIMEFHRQS